MITQSNKWRSSSYIKAQYVHVGHLIDRVFTYRSPVLREQRSEQPLYDLLSRCRLTDCASKRSASAALELKIQTLTIIPENISGYVYQQGTFQLQINRDQCHLEDDKPTSSYNKFLLPG